MMESGTPATGTAQATLAVTAAAAAKVGSISEALREEETLRYGSSLLADAVVNDSPAPLEHSRLAASSDAALAAFAQLAAFKLNTERALISLFDGKRQYIVAEATRSTAIELGPAHDHPADAHAPHPEALTILLSGTAIPRSYGACEHALDLPAVRESGDVLLPILVVPDLAQDDRFACSPYFGPHSPLRFYAGVPIRSPQGIDIGVCCIFDGHPRDGLDASSRRFLRHMSGLVMSHLHSRVSAESYRRSERMVRGLGSMVEGTGSLSQMRNAPNPDFFADVEGREGALNVQQQSIQRQIRRPPSPDLERPTADPVQEGDRSEDGAEDTTADSTDTLSTENELRTKHPFTSYSGPQQDDDQVILRSLFSRAANIIRESIEIEGALFLDAAIESYGGLVPHMDAESQRRSPGSSGDESATTDEGTLKQESCRVLGFSTSGASSINGDVASAEHTSVPDTFLARILRRYPGGQVFNFDEDGSIIWAVSDSSEGDAVSSDDAGNQRKRPEKPSQNPSRKGDSAFLIRMFPGARSVALVPLWDSHKERWFAAGFVWTRARARVFSVQGELSYLRAFGSATMAEVARISVLRENKAKEDVLGSLSHEIRSPLHGVILGVELMHDSDLTAFQDDVLHTVENCGRTLLDTMDHLLDFSKVNHFLRAPKRKVRGLSMTSDGRSSIEVGMMSIFSDVSIDLLFEEVVESVYAGFSFQNTSGRWAERESAKASYFHQAGTLRRLESVRQMDNGGDVPGTSRPDAGVDVYLSIDPNVSWDFHAQSGALRRIVMNIFGNALKYTTRGSILVSLTQEPASVKRKSRRRTIVLSISDSGRGISSEYLQNRLFQPFAQENQLSSGAGLGLSLVKHIVHGLGGRISVESRVGQGTTARILIPLRLSSPRTSPTTLPLQANNDFAEYLKRLEGVSVALLGFPRDFGADKPLAAESSDTQLSPKLFMEALCQRCLHLHVVSELEAVSTPPSLYICTENTLNEIPVLNGQLYPLPVVVLCSSVLAAHELATKFRADPPHIVRECTAQPVGPRKLSKVLVLALDRWRKSRDSSRATGQVSLLTKGIGVQVPTPQPEANMFFQEPFLAASDEGHEDALTPLALPHRTFAKSFGGVENGDTTAATALAAVLSPQQDASQSLFGLVNMADFLLVDDNAINLKILESYMKKFGRNHDSARNGLEAFEACRARPVNYRCIFMDISMPVMDGLESTRLIRAHEKQNRLQPSFIIALTGLASAKTQQEAFASGVDLFLTKPVPLKELGRILGAQGV